MQIQTSEEHLNAAKRKATRVSQDKGETNEKKRACKWAAMQIQTLTQELVVPLGKYMRVFPTLERLHPFERAQVVLTVGEVTYPRILSKVDQLRKSVLTVSSPYNRTFIPVTTRPVHPRCNLSPLLLFMLTFTYYAGG